MTAAEQERWDALTTRMVLGDPLSAEEQGFIDEQRRRDPAAAAELAMLDGLANVVDNAGGPDVAATALAQAALAEVGSPAASGGDFDSPSSSLPAATREATTDDPGSSAVAPSRRVFWIATAAVALAAAAVVAFLLVGRGTTPATAEPQPVIASLTMSSGEVFVDGHPAVETSGALADGATLVVGPDSTACFAIDTAVDVCLAPSTNATVHDLDEDSRRVEVEYGGAVARLRPSTRVESFALSSGDIRATAIGTIFTLRTDHDAGRTTTSVLEGTIRVDTGNEVLRLEAPEQVSIQGGQATRGRPEPAREVEDLALLGQAPAPSEGPLARLIAESSPSGALVMVDGVEIGQSPVTISLGLGAHVVELLSEGRSSIRETVVVEAGDTVRRRFALEESPLARAEEPRVEGGGRMDGPAPDDEGDAAEDDSQDAAAEAEDAHPPRDEPVKPAATAAQMIADARRLLRDSKWAAAARAYSALRRAHPKSAEAHAALVSLGDLQLDHLGKPRAAARSYERYLKRGGALALEARYGRVRAYRAAHDREREAKAIRSFLGAHPSNARSPALKTRLSELDPS